MQLPRAGLRHFLCPEYGAVFQGLRALPFLRVALNRTDTESLPVARRETWPSSRLAAFCRRTLQSA
jgi:hypothetical protein